MSINQCRLSWSSSAASTASRPLLLVTHTMDRIPKFINNVYSLTVLLRLVAYNMFPSIHLIFLVLSQKRVYNIIGFIFSTTARVHWTTCDQCEIDKSFDFICGTELQSQIYINPTNKCRALLLLSQCTINAIRKCRNLFVAH